MEDTTATPVPEEKKSWFETVVISTPVLLTVIATFLIGRASTEMTFAQYYRSLASQNQSKVGDQWGFFQAKRIRGQILEGNADLLRAQPRAPFTRATLVDSTRGILRALSDETAKENVVLLAEAMALVADTTSALDPPAAGWQGERHLLKPDNVQAALSALQPKLKKATARSKESAEPKNSEQTELLKDVLADIKARRHESEIAPKVLKIEDATLDDAIKDADRRADEVYRQGKSIENVLEEFDALLDRQTALAFEFEQLAAQSKQPPPASLEKIRALQAKVQGDYNAVRHAYSGRRYEDDARSNQESANLYEVKVFLNSARSDKHLFRSRMFLLATLIAQAGVTIATLALAVKRKSVFWLLAALTGVTSIAFGLYVYLDLWPLPTF